MAGGLNRIRPVPGARPLTAAPLVLTGGTDRRLRGNRKLRKACGVDGGLPAGFTWLFRRPGQKA
jgi:hypothetical protein